MDKRQESQGDLPGLPSISLADLEAFRQQSGQIRKATGSSPGKIRKATGSSPRTGSEPEGTRNRNIGATAYQVTGKIWKPSGSRAGYGLYFFPSMVP